MPEDSTDQTVILKSRITKRSATTLSLIAAFDLLLIWIVFANSNPTSYFFVLLLALVTTAVATFIASHCTKSLRIYDDCLLFSSWIGQKVVFKKDVVKLESGYDSRKSIRLVLRSMIPVNFHADHWMDGDNVVKTASQWAKEAVDQNGKVVAMEREVDMLSEKLELTTEMWIAKLRRSLKNSGKQPVTPAEEILESE